MKTIVNYIILLGLIFCVALTQAQDPHFSMYSEMPVYINPSNTGFHNGVQRAHVQYRNQWSSILGNPYSSLFMSYDTKAADRIGVGGFFMNHKAGSGGYSSMSFMLSGAYDIAIDGSEKHALKTGLQIGGYYKHVNPSNYLFESQYTTDGDGGFDPSLPNNESLTKVGIFKMDVNFGCLYSLNYRPNESFSPFIGFSLHHITQPRETFFGINNRLPMRKLIHIGSRLAAGRDMTITPELLYMNQVKNNEIHIGLTGRYIFRNSKSLRKINAQAFYGLFYRNKDALALFAGFAAREYQFRLAYDINTSSLKTYTHSRGAIEFSFSYFVPDKQKVLFM